MGRFFNSTGSGGYDGGGDNSTGVCIVSGYTNTTLTDTEDGYSLRTNSYGTKFIDNTSSIDLSIAKIAGTQYNSENAAIEKRNTLISDTDMSTQDSEVSISTIVTNETIYKDNTDG